MEAPLPAGGFTAALRAPRGRRSSKDFESSVLPELANGGQKSGRSRRASKDNLFSGVLVKQVLIARPNQSDEQKEGGDVPANGSWEMRPLIRQR